MTTIITTIALVRLIPYLLVTIIAYKKGHSWFMVCGAYVMGMVIYTYFYHPSPSIQALLGSFTAFFLMMHALKMETRRK